MEPYQERVVKEKEALDDKRALLCEFLNSPMCKKASNIENRLLVKQLTHMERYSRVLEERIKMYR